MKHFQIKDLPFTYDNIFVYCVRDADYIEDLPEGFQRCTIGDRLMIPNVLWAKGFNENPVNYAHEDFTIVRQYQRSLGIMFLAAIRL